MIIDAHAHIFPEKIASKAIAGLEQQYGVNACAEATVPGIYTSMQSGHVDASVLLSVATTTAQVESINNWVAEISTDAPRFIGLGAMHPEYPDPDEEIRRMREMGIKGIKLHSEFQHFYPDDERAHYARQGCQCTGLISQVESSSRPPGRIPLLGRGGAPPAGQGPVPGYSLCVPNTPTRAHHSGAHHRHNGDAWL